MNNHHQSSDMWEKLFQYMLLAAALSIFMLIVLGIVVRVTESGTACPDWPTCAGRWTPPSDHGALIPYLHRFATAMTSILILGSIIVAGWRYRGYRWIYWPLIGSAILLSLQVSLGRLLVIRIDAPGLAALHLGLALMIQALVLIPLAVTLSLSDTPSNRLKEGKTGSISSINLVYRSPFGRLSLLALAVVFALLVSGTWVSASGATSTCSGWPLCGNNVFPGNLPGWINMAHRIISVSAGILVLALLIKAWRTQTSHTAILVTSTAVAVLFVSQVLMGSVETTWGLPEYLRGLHVATATAVWAALVLQVGLVGLAATTSEDEREEAASHQGRKFSGLMKDYLQLTKPIVVILLLVTTFAGMVVGAKAWPSRELVFWTLLAGFMAAGGSGAINQYIDRFDDIKMQRTAHRPIPSGRLTPAEGLAFGVAMALASFYLMVAFVNFLAALLTLAGIIYYVLVYSILLKKTTVQNIVIGGGAGAIPPLVGWAAATGSLNLPSLFLFAVVFMWTPPHFWALALVRRNDYARAGVPMLPVVRGEKETRWQIFIYTIELVALTLVLPLFGLGGSIYLVSAAVLGGALLYTAWKVWRGEGNKVAWKMYRHSSLYLAFLFVALMADALL